MIKALRQPRAGHHAFKQSIHVVAIALTLLLPASTAAPAWGKGLESAKWIEARSPNFRLLSIASRKKTIRLARDLEMFLASILTLTNAESMVSVIPTHIFVFRGRRDFKKIGIDPKNAGIFFQTIRGNFVVAHDPRGSVGAASVLQHELVHFLLRNHGEFNYPMWYEEGLAEYFSTATIKDGRYVVGLPAKHRVAALVNLPWISMHKVLAPKGYIGWSDEHKQLFYAQAWALVHFLLDQDRDELMQKMAAYLEKVEAGANEVDAFKSAFALDAYRLNREVRNYVMAGRYSTFVSSMDKFLPEQETEVVTLSRGRASLELAQLTLELGEVGRSEELFATAIGDEQMRPRAEAGMGRVFVFREKLEAARNYFQMAVQLAPDDPYCQLDLANYWYLRAARSEKPADQLSYLERARSHYIEAWKLDDSVPEPYAMYGATFTMQGEHHEKAIEMLEEAAFLLPSNLRIRLMLAEAYAAAYRTVDAAAAAQSILSWGHGISKEEAQIAQQILSWAETSVPADTIEFPSESFNSWELPTEWEWPLPDE
jgi:tetratricopeptide (TPR) repeat protein